MININNKEVIKFCISVLLVVGICLGIGIMPTLAAGDDVILLKLAHINAPDPSTSHGQAFSLAFKNYVEAASAGRIEVEIHPAGALGNNKEMLELTQFGVIQMTLAGEGNISPYYPRAMVNSIPYLYSSDHLAMHVLDGDFAQELMADLPEQTDLRSVGMVDMGRLSFSNRVRPIKTLEDMKGLRIRTMENRLHIAFIQSLGASAVPIAWPEVYTSLQTGVVDGQMNPVADIIQHKIYEVQDYVTVSTGITGVIHYLVNDEWFCNLPEDLQKIILEGVREGKIVARGVNKLLGVTGVDYLNKQGTKVNFIDPEQIEKFKTAAQAAAIAMLEKEIGMKWIDKALEAAKEAQITLDEEAKIWMK